MIINLLAGIVLATSVFATLMWCVYQCVSQTGWRRWVHFALMVLLIAVFVPFVFSRELLVSGVSIAILIVSVGFILANRWPTWLLGIPPQILAVVILSNPQMLALAA